MPARDADDRVTLVFFGYTNCPDVCNVVLANIATALRRAEPSVRNAVTLLFITTDPERDTAHVVRAYLDQFDPSYVGLLAPLPAVRRAAERLHISYRGKHRATADGYEVMHGSQITVFVNGRARLLWRAETPVRNLRADLIKLTVARESGAALRGR